MWEIIIGIILILIIVDIYFRIRSNADEIWYLLLITDVVNKALADNKIIDKEKLRKSMKEVIINTKMANPKRYERALKALKRKGIILDM